MTPGCRYRLRTTIRNGQSFSSARRRESGLFLEPWRCGSTSVPGLVAKPIIDVLLVVADSADEAAYVSKLEAAGYSLRIRGPEWYEHRMFKGPDTDINLHVFSHGCAEVDRVLLFRDWLRVNDADRELYAGAKFSLSQKEWQSVDDYAQAKTAVIEEILTRAIAKEKPVPAT
jgi:GrpB-like predicted nucleotidyltransferase (UPF0157 family)